ncbi:MAG: site-specific integrase [Armatimonadota bacterium]|nr:site-specific integrase [Armatimonadota bacterium]
MDPPRRRKYELRVWDEEQVRLFLAEARGSSPYHTLHLTAIMAGMRQGELLGLRWQDVDFVRGIARVTQTFYRLGSKQIFKPPKTETSRSAVALPPVVIEELRRLREQQEEYRLLLGPEYATDLDLIFCQPNGKPLHAHNVVRRDFRRVIERAGLPRIRFHDLRHIHASYLARAGVPPKVAQERLGHSTLTFTMKVYTYTLAGMQEQAARAVASYLLGRP